MSAVHLEYDVIAGWDYAVSAGLGRELTPYWANVTNHRARTDMISTAN